MVFFAWSYMKRCWEVVFAPTSICISDILGDMDFGFDSTHFYYFFFGFRISKSRFPDFWLGRGWAGPGGGLLEEHVRNHTEEGQDICCYH